MRAPRAGARPKHVMLNSACCATTLMCAVWFALPASPALISAESQAHGTEESVSYTHLRAHETSAHL
eukprot:7928486-Alexandrium_andersonii.AAC.1